jgi:hypothetical protein
MSYASFASTTTPKARRQYGCYFCNDAILKGEIHTKVVGQWDGDFGQYRAHNECMKATEKWKPDDRDCFEPGDMQRGVNPLEKQPI